MKLSVMTPLRRTLGFFQWGIPVIFIKNDVVFRSNSNTDDYLNLINSQGGAKSNAIFDDNAARAFNRHATIFHELRHFHDALLCRPLFEQFLCQQGFTWHIMQIVNRLAELRHLPKTITDSIWRSDDTLSKLKKIIDDADEYTYDRTASLYNEVNIGTDSIKIDHLLEASAIVTELLHIYTIHGIDAVETYYKLIIAKSDSTYNMLANRFIAIYSGSIVKALSALYCALAISLYSSNTPVDHFSCLYKKLQDDPSSIEDLMNRWCADPFPNEDAYFCDIHSNHPIDRSSNDYSETVRRLGLEPYIDEMSSLQDSLCKARANLIERYVKQYGYQGNLYIEHLHEFPSAALLFYPIDAGSISGIAPAMLEKNLNIIDKNIYPIAWIEGEEGRIIVAGMKNVPTTRPCVSFEVTNQMLFAKYCHQFLFEGKETLYSRGVDDLYLKTLKAIVMQ